MSEPEFDLYLSLMSKFLRLNAAQKDDIAEELRVHLEDRLAELTAQGKSREEAIRLALDEFGDAGALAWQFTLPHSLRRRRQIMRYTFGSFVALAGIFTLVSLTWPNRPDRPPEVQKVAAQAESSPTVVGLQSPQAAANDPVSQDRKAIDDKLASRELEFHFVDTPLSDALQTISDQIDLPFVYSVSNREILIGNQITLGTPKDRLSIRTALELILRHGEGLSYSIKDGVILITDSNEDYEVQVYDCRDLLAGVQVQGTIQTGGGGMGMGGTGGGFFSVPVELTEAMLSQQFGRGGDEDEVPPMLGGKAKRRPALPGAQPAVGLPGGLPGGGRPAPDAGAAATSPAGAALIGVLQSATRPARWINTDGDGGSMSEFDGVIVVRHHQAVHRKIEDVLAKLRKVKRGQQVTVTPDSDDIEPLKIPAGKRLITLNANWEIPINAIRPGSRVDIVRFSGSRDDDPRVLVSNAEIVLPRITPLYHGGIGVPTSWNLNSVNVIVTPEQAVELINAENTTPIPLKFFLRSDEDGDDDDNPATEEATENRDDDEVNGRAVEADEAQPEE